MNFKMKVSKNIGLFSENVFGCVGTEINVIDGNFYDIVVFNDKPFKNIDEINEYFGEEDEFQTEFELVKEEY